MLTAVIVFNREIPRVSLGAKVTHSKFENQAFSKLLN